MRKLLMVSCPSFGLPGASTLVAAQDTADLAPRLEATLLDVQARYGFPGATDGWYGDHGRCRACRC
jgi:hypothetical protein